VNEDEVEESTIDWLSHGSCLSIAQITASHTRYTLIIIINLSIRTEHFSGKYEMFALPLAKLRFRSVRAPLLQNSPVPSELQNLIL
jgi:hypothetical protein